MLRFMSNADPQGALRMRQETANLLGNAPLGPVRSGLALDVETLPEPELGRHMSGEVFSPGAPYAPEPLTLTVESPDRAMFRAEHFNTNRFRQQAETAATGAQTLATAVAGPQAMQQALDGARAASVGRVAIDPLVFSEEYRLGVMNPGQRGTIDAALQVLSRPPV